MRTGNTAIDTVIDRLKTFLPQYLVDRGVRQQSGKWFCIHPDHDNKKSAAMSLIPATGNTMLRCFSNRCGVSANILHAAHWLEGLPLSGPEFITQTLATLCTRWDIELPDVELSPRDLHLMKVRETYRHAAEVLLVTTDTQAAIQARGWTPETSRSLGIGNVRSWETFQQVLCHRANVESDFLAQCDITRKLFSKEMLTFTLRDQWGQPVGFSARFLRFEQVKEAIKAGEMPKDTWAVKYLNTGEACPIFDKARILYGLDKAKGKSPIWIFEGQGSVVTANQAGMKNCVATLGSITKEHVQLLQEVGCTDIILCRDWDRNAAGQKATLLEIDKYFSGVADIRVRVVDWYPLLHGRQLVPDVNQKPQHIELGDWEGWDEFPGFQSADADSWIQEYGLEDLQSLPKLSSFAWRLRASLANQASPEETCKKVIPTVVNEPMAIDRDRMCRELSEISGVSLDAIRQDLDRLMRLADRDLLETQDTLKGELDKRWGYMDTHQRMEAVQDFGKQITDKTVANDVESTGSVLQRMSEMHERMDAFTEGMIGWDTGFPILNHAFGDGMPKREAFIALAGLPNIGKTAFMANLAHNLVTLNNDMRLMIFTIDDTLGQFMPRLYGINAGLSLKLAANPGQFLTTEQENRDKLLESRSLFMDMVGTGKLDIRDAANASTITYLERWIQSARKSYDGNLVLILDNFHKLKQVSQDRRLHFVNCSSKLLEMRALYDMTVLCTMELRKPESGGRRRRPAPDEIIESGQMEYDAQAVIMMHQDLHVNPESEKVWIDENIDMGDAEWELKQRKPINEFWWDKNKISDYKGKIEYRFNPSHSSFQELTHEEMLANVGTVVTGGNGHTTTVPDRPLDSY